MSKVSVARSGAIVALALVAASCGSSEEGNAAESTETTVTAEATTTTAKPTTTTTAAPTAEEISEIYCETAFKANAESIDYELSNGPESTLTGDYLDVGLSRMQSLELIPDEIEAEFSLVINGLAEIRDRSEAANDEIAFEELEDILTPEFSEASTELDNYEAEVCGFTYDEMALEAGLGPVSSIEGSELFFDPEGEYSIEINPEWAASHGSIAAGIELWYINDGTDGFAENLNLLTQQVGDVGLEEYLELSADSISVLLQDGAVLDQAIVPGSLGQDLGVLLYEGAVGNQVGTFLAVFAVEDGTAVIATFVALPDEFDDLVLEVEEYMFTLVAE